MASSLFKLFRFFFSPFAGVWCGWSMVGSFLLLLLLLSPVLLLVLFHFYAWSCSFINLTFVSSIWSLCFLMRSVHHSFERGRLSHRVVLRPTPTERTLNALPNAMQSFEMDSIECEKQASGWTVQLASIRDDWNLVFVSLAFCGFVCVLSFCVCVWIFVWEKFYWNEKCLLIVNLSYLILWIFEKIGLVMRSRPARAPWCFRIAFGLFRRNDNFRMNFMGFSNWKSHLESDQARFQNEFHAIIHERYENVFEKYLGSFCDSSVRQTQ